MQVWATCLMSGFVKSVSSEICKLDSLP
jgi:hypothetical protein